MQIRNDNGEWQELQKMVKEATGETITEKLLNQAAERRSLTKEVNKAWEALKKDGNQHYKTDGGVECVDLYRAGKMFRDWAMGNIIGYAFRCRREFEREPALVVQDCRKIIDIANKMIASFEIDNG